MRGTRKDRGLEPDEVITSGLGETDEFVSTEADVDFFDAPMPAEDAPTPRAGRDRLSKPEPRAKLSQAERFEVPDRPSSLDEETREIPPVPPTPRPSPPPAASPAPRPRPSSASIEASVSSREPKTVRRGSRLPWVLAALAGMGLCFVLGTSIGVIVTWGWLWAWSGGASVEPVAVVEEPEEPPGVAAPAPTPTPTPPSVAGALPEPNQLHAEPTADSPPIVPQPVAAAPAPAPAPAAPVSKAPVPAAAAPAPAPVIPAGPRVEEVAVTTEGATRTTLKCGGMVATGATSARLTQVPAGMCTIEVVLGGETHRMGFGLESATTLSCAVTEGVLRCS